MPDIKTREVVRGTVKAIDKSAVAGERMKQAYIRTKDKAEHGIYSAESSPNEYAADQITGTDTPSIQTEVSRSRIFPDSKPAPNSRGGGLHRNRPKRKHSKKRR